MIEQWVIDQLNPLKGEKLIILADPQRMIRAGARAVDGWAKENGFTVLFCSGNLALREMYENLRDDPTAKLILVDRTRDKAKLPLFYPDLEARCKPRARLTITLRDFLIEKTGDQRWPLLVNTDRNIGRLILENLPQALQAHAQLRDVDEHRFTDSDLYKIVLGATLGINPFHKLSAGEIRRLCIENHERLEQVRDFFSGGPSEEASEVLGKLREQIEQGRQAVVLDARPRPPGGRPGLHPLGDHAPARRRVRCPARQLRDRTGALPEDPQEGPSSKPSRTCSRPTPTRSPRTWGRSRRFLKEEPEKRLAFLLADRCKIDQPEQAKAVLLAEKLSGLVRSLALLSLLIDLLTNRKTAFHKQILDALDEEGTKGKADALPIAARRPTPQWSTLLATYRRAIQFFEIAEQAQGRGPQDQGSQARPA